MQEVGGSIPPSSTTLPMTWRPRPKSGDPPIVSLPEFASSEEHTEMIRLATACCGLLLANLAVAQTTSKTPNAPTCLTINGQVNPASCATGTTLLAYIQSLGASRGGVLSGQTADPFSQNPLDVFTGSASNWTVGSPGPQTNLTPAILNLFVQGPDNGGSPRAGEDTSG